MAAAIVGPDAGLRAAVAGALRPGARLIGTGAAGQGYVPFSSCRGEPSALPGIPQPQPSDPAVIFYTSGTTGLPKGVVVPHGAVWSRHLVPLLGLDFGGHNRFEGHMPICHPAGYHGVLMGALSCGGTYYLVPALEPESLVALVAAQNITVMLAAPARWHALLQTPSFSTEAIASLQAAAYGGAPMAAGLLHRLTAALPCPLYQVYGITEAGHVGFLLQTGRKPGALRPTGYCQLRAIRLGGQPDETVPPGEVGELIADAGADALFLEYLHRPAVTAAAVTGGWYRTGDLVIFDHDGDFQLAGRADDMIISGASNIHPEEVEASLGTYPASPISLWSAFPTTVTVTSSSPAQWMAAPAPQTSTRTAAPAAWPTSNAPGLPVPSRAPSQQPGQNPARRTAHRRRRRSPQRPARLHQPRLATTAWLPFSGHVPNPGRFASRP
jgi:acyl-CoA synthetase (AMP-forming)/AMP-acid ligase II